MKKNLLLFSGIFTAFAINAQITITSTDLPVGGDSIYVNVTNNIGTADPEIAGPNFSLDYSTLGSSSTRFEKFDAPLTFPSIYAYLFNPLNTTFGKNNSNFTSGSIIPITAAYDFFKKSSSMLKQIGSGYIINNIPLPFVYSQSDIVYRFPMNYLNQDSCDYKFGLAIPNMGYYGQTGHRVNVVDGWGTLITPTDTFQTLRIKTTISSIDTIYIDSISFGTHIQRPLRYEYKWFANGKKIPVLEIDATRIAGVPVVNNVQYFDISTVGITEPEQKFINMTAYPNPSFEKVDIQYDLTSGTHIKLSLTDVIGKTLAKVIDEDQRSGTHKQTIDLTAFHLSPGIYFLNLDTDNQRSTKKIIITK